MKLRNFSFTKSTFLCNFYFLFGFLSKILRWRLLRRFFFLCHTHELENYTPWWNVATLHWHNCYQESNMLLIMKNLGNVGQFHHTCQFLISSYSVILIESEVRQKLKRGTIKSGFSDSGVSVTQPPMDQMTWNFAVPHFLCQNVRTYICPENKMENFVDMWQIIFQDVCRSLSVSHYVCQILAIFILYLTKFFVCSPPL